MKSMPCSGHNKEPRAVDPRTFQEGVDRGFKLVPENFQATPGSKALTHFKEVGSIENPGLPISVVRHQGTLRMSHS